MRSHRLVLTVLAALVLSGTLAEAAIINVTLNTGPGFEANKFVYLTPPWGSLSTPANTVGQNNFNVRDTLYAFDEFSGPLSATVTPDLGPMLAIPAGTLVTSHFIFYDPSTIGDVGATIQFDQPILGVIRRTPSMNATDSVFAHPSVTYATPNQRGLETSDILNIIAPDTIKIDWRASSPGDHIRVITAFVPTGGPVIPEPASIMLYGLGAGACALGCVLRRRTR